MFKSLFKELLRQKVPIIFVVVPLVIIWGLTTYFLFHRASSMWGLSFLVVSLVIVIGFACLLVNWIWKPRKYKMVFFFVMLLTCILIYLGALLFCPFLRVSQIHEGVTELLINKGSNIGFYEYAKDLKFPNLKILAGWLIYGEITILVTLAFGMKTLDHLRFFNIVYIILSLVVAIFVIWLVDVQYFRLEIEEDLTPFQKVIIGNLFVGSFSLFALYLFPLFYDVDKFIEETFRRRMVRKWRLIENHIIFAGDFVSVKESIADILPWLINRWALISRPKWPEKIIPVRRNNWELQSLVTGTVALIAPGTTAHRTFEDPRLGVISYIEIEYDEMKRKLSKKAKNWLRLDETKRPKYHEGIILIPVVVDELDKKRGWYKTRVQFARKTVVRLPEITKAMQVFDWFSENKYPAVFQIQGGVYQQFAVRRQIKSPIATVFPMQLLGIEQAILIFGSLFKKARVKENTPMGGNPGAE